MVAEKTKASADLAALTIGRSINLNILITVLIGNSYIIPPLPVRHGSKPE